MTEDQSNKLYPENISENIEHSNLDCTENQNEKKSDTTDNTLQKMQEDLSTANEKYIRLYAEFDNFRKRTNQEKLTLIDTASERILHRVIPIIDDFERALVSFPKKEAISETFVVVQEGIKLIYDKMLHLLEQSGVQPMAVVKGSTFDTELHEAITKTPVTDTQLCGKVVDVIEKGYLLKNKVLRYAKVIIGE